MQQRDYIILWVIISSCLDTIEFLPLVRDSSLLWLLNKSSEKYVSSVCEIAFQTYPVVLSGHCEI